jgi:hypothetical protein
VSCIDGCFRFFTSTQCLQSGQGLLFSRTDLRQCDWLDGMGHLTQHPQTLATTPFQESPDKIWP